jgi:hypothetical protein
MELLIAFGTDDSENLTNGHAGDARYFYLYKFSDNKEKIKEIYEVLPKSDDQRCGYKSCGEFARAVAEGKTPCYGCVSGGPEVAAKVCEIMGARVPEEAIRQFGPSPGFYQPGLSEDRAMGRGTDRGLGLGRGRGMDPGRGMGRGGGMSRGFGRGRRGR